VREDHIGWLVVVLMVLAAADGSDVRGNAGVDDDVFFAGVEVDWDASDDLEAVAVVDFVGYGS